MNTMVSRAKRLRARRGASTVGAILTPIGAVALCVIAAPGCTLQNSVQDDPAGNAPSNAYRDAPAERSEELWVDPGENLLSALAEVEMNDRTAVLPTNNRVLGSVFGELGAYFSAITAYTPFGAAFEQQSMECVRSVLPDAVEDLCQRIAGGQPDPNDPEDDGAIQLVIVNDLPHAAFQRTLMRKILPCAYELGFTYLAVEALGEDDAALEARNFVSRSESGLYTREPQMAGLLEDAMALGYDVVSYDVPDPCTGCAYVEALTQKSDAQAANIVAKTFAIDPEAKVLVFAGARQSYKRIWGPGEPYATSLGRRIWEQIDIEPYSVDQVAIDLPAMPFGASSPNPPSGMYLATGPLNGQCMGSYTPDSPTGMGTLDSIVVHVPPRTDAARWDWLHAPAEQRQAVTINCASCSAAQRLLVQAFPAGIDRTDRVATDQALCDAGARCQLVLPPGPYQLVVWNETALVGEGAVELSGSDAVTASF